LRKIDASLSHLENCSSRQINITLRHQRGLAIFLRSHRPPNVRNSQAT
jgi:hypothetical protein